MTLYRAVLVLTVLVGGFAAVGLGMRVLEALSGRPF